MSRRYELRDGAGNVVSITSKNKEKALEWALGPMGMKHAPVSIKHIPKRKASAKVQKGI